MHASICRTPAQDYELTGFPRRAALFFAVMVSLFLGLTIANLTSLLVTIGLGYAGMGPGLRGWHMLAGAMALILCIAVHCVVVTYFIATAKWISHAVEVKRLDAAYTLPTRSFKQQAFPAALGAMVAVFVTAMLGAAVDNRMVSTTWHHFLALGSFGINLGAAVAEHAAIRRNGQLIDRILTEANQA